MRKIECSAGFIGLAWALAQGCATKEPGTDGETHWACTSDADCGARGLAGPCVGGFCAEGATRDGGREDAGHDDAGRDAAAPRPDAATQPPEGGATCAALNPGILCSNQLGDWTGDGGSSFPLVGTVTEIVPGGPRCPTNDYPEIGTTWRARVWDGKRGLEFSLPSAWPLFEVGDVISVEATYAATFFQATDAYTEVRTSKGDLLFWSAASGSIASLRTPPEVTVAAGAAVCEGRDVPCGVWRNHRIQLTLSGSTSEVGPGESAQIGAFHIASGGASEQVTQTTPCADWFVGAAAATVVRGTARTLVDKPKCGGVDCAGSEYCEPAPGSDCFSIATGAACQPRPTSCGKDCPGVCGCDGKFYCDACYAEMAGVAVAPGITDCLALAPGCAASNTGMVGSFCEASWSCKDVGYPSDYAVRCDASDGGAQCDCQQDGVTVRTVTVPSVSDPVSCDRGMPVPCGFPAQISAF